MIDLASALWNQRHEIRQATDRFVQLRSIVNWPGDLDLGTWIQFYTMCLEFGPDLIVELGRGYGNSTCVFTEAANRLGKTQVFSVGYDHERGWSTRTAPRLVGLVGSEWFKPLHILEQDILKTNFSEILAARKRVLFFWDAHGKEVARYVLGEIMPQLQLKDHVVLVHDIADASYFHMDPGYVREDGLPQFWLGHLVSPFEELLPLYDFLSRNRIRFTSPPQSLRREVLQNGAKRAELENCWGADFPHPTPLEAGTWIYFSMDNRFVNGPVKTPIVFPEPGFQDQARRARRQEICGTVSQRTPPGARETMIDLASALWNQRQQITRAKERLTLLHRLVGSPNDLDLGTYVQYYAFALDFAPDLIVELGRGYGNSTCVFTEAANQLGKTRVVSIDYDPGWSSRTVRRLKNHLPSEWFRRLQILEQDILSTKFSTILASANRILFLWDAHGIDVAHHILADALPHLQGKDHVVLVHDITDAKFFSVDPSYLRNDGLPTFWVGNLVSSFEELIPLYDFLSRNHMPFFTPQESMDREILHDRDKQVELGKCWGADFPSPIPTEAGHWIYFSLNYRDPQAGERNITFPDLAELKQGQKKLQHLGLKQSLKKVTPAPIWELLRRVKRSRQTSR